MERLPWQFCYWSGVLILFAWAAWARFALPLDPIADPDTWGYLSPALRKLTGAEFGHTNGRNFIYPGFLYLLLRVFRDFRAITVAQHFFGLLAGGILVLTWRRARVFVPNPRVGHAVHAGLGLVAAAIFLLASEPIRFETQLRPEGVCAFLISVNLYFVIQFTACFFVERRQAASVAYGIAAVFSSILLASAKPSFWLASIVVLLPVAMFFVQRGLIWQKIALGGGAALSAALLLLPEHFLSRNDEASQTFLPTTLFVIHANLIRDQMADDLRRDANVRYPREWLEHVHARAQRRNREICRGLVPDLFELSALILIIYGTIKTSIAAQLHKRVRQTMSPRFARFIDSITGEFGGNDRFLSSKKSRDKWRFFMHRSAPSTTAANLSHSDAYHRAMMSLDIQPYHKISAAYPPAMDFMAGRNRVHGARRSFISHAIFGGTLCHGRIRICHCF